MKQGMATPSTPLKKQTIATSDGHTITSEYHAELQPKTESSAPKYSAATSGPNAGIDPYTLTKPSSGLISTPLPSPQYQAPVATPQAPTAPTTPTYAGLIGQIASKSSGPSAEYADATSRARTAYQEAGDTNQVIGRSEQDALHNPNYSLDTGIGRAGQIASNYGLIGQNALTRAQGEAALVGAANTQQNTQQSGLIGAANLAAPTQVPYSNQLVNPATGLPVNPNAGADMQSAVQLQVQKLKSGATDPSSARAALSAYGQAGINELEKALGSSFNPNISSANQSSAADLTTRKNDLQSTFNGVDSNFKLLINTASQGGVNDMNVPVLNTLQQNVARGLASNEAVINFKNTLAAVRSGYAQILGGGTTTVDSQNRAQDAIPDNISLSALQSLGEQLKSEAQNRIQGIDQQIRSITGGGSNSGAVVDTKSGPITVNW